MELLPDELITYICTLLDYDDIGRMCMVTKNLGIIGSSDELWQLVLHDNVLIPKNDIKTYINNYAISDFNKIIPIIRSHTYYKVYCKFIYHFNYMVDITISVGHHIQDEIYDIKNLLVMKRFDDDYVINSHIEDHIDIDWLPYNYSVKFCTPKEFNIEYIKWIEKYRWLQTK